MTAPTAPSRPDELLERALEAAAGGPGGGEFGSGVSGGLRAIVARRCALSAWSAPLDAFATLSGWSVL